MDTFDIDVDFGAEADNLIAREVGRQNAIWGQTQSREDVGEGQLFDASLAHMMGSAAVRGGSHYMVGASFYPPGWTGYRDYGSEVANLVVAAAFIRQEIKRLISEGADTTRKPRPE